MYYNYIKQTEDLYQVIDCVDKKYHHTLRIMLDEVIYHFLDSHKVPYEKQGEFLTIMFPDCKKVVEDYKTKRFTID